MGFILVLGVAASLPCQYTHFLLICDMSVPLTMKNWVWRLLFHVSTPNLSTLFTCFGCSSLLTVPIHPFSAYLRHVCASHSEKLGVETAFSRLHTQNRFLIEWINRNIPSNSHPLLWQPHDLPGLPRLQGTVLCAYPLR